VDLDDRRDSVDRFSDRRDPQSRPKVIARRWSAFSIVCLALFFVWEMAQAKFFASMQALHFWPATLLCLKASAGDLVISAVSFVVAAATVRALLWPVKRHLGISLTAFLITGLEITVVYELYAISHGVWTYDPSMPTVAGVGLLPLLKWVIIPLLQVVVFRAIWSANGSR
jgi:hypothetical protein